MPIVWNTKWWVPFNRFKPFIIGYPQWDGVGGWEVEDWDKWMGIPFRLLISLCSGVHICGVGILSGGDWTLSGDGGNFREQLMQIIRGKEEASSFVWWCDWVQIEGANSSVSMIPLWSKGREVVLWVSEGKGVPVGRFPWRIFEAHSGGCRVGLAFNHI